jgi:hypothetical protein
MSKCWGYLILAVALGVLIGRFGGTFGDGPSVQPGSYPPGAVEQANTTPTLWRKGPPPKGTWMWGGVMPKGESHTSFYFADFWGGHAKIYKSGKWERIEFANIAYWNNSLALPLPRTLTEE